MVEPVQKWSLLARFFLRLRFHWHDFAFTLQGLLTLFYSPLFTVIDAKFNYLDIKPFATHSAFYNLFVICIVLVVIGLSVMTYVFLLEEDEGREEYPNVIGCQLISAATFVAVLGAPLNLLFVLYLPSHKRLFGYVTFTAIGTFVLLVTLIGYFHDSYFSNNGGGGNDDGGGNGGGGRRGGNGNGGGGRNGGRGGDTEVPHLEEEDADGKHDQKLDMDKLTQSVGSSSVTLTSASRRVQKLGKSPLTAIQASNTKSSSKGATKLASWKPRGLSHLRLSYRLCTYVLKAPYYVGAISYFAS